VGTRAGSEASLAEVLGVLSRTCRGTPVFLQLKAPREQHSSKDADAADCPHEVLCSTLQWVMHCWRARPICWRYTQCAVCCVVQAALGHSTVRPAQVLAEACGRQATNLLQSACGQSMAHMAVIGAEALAAGLHVVYGLPASNTAEAHVAACCCKQA
jgi:hypothetical protein